MFRVILSIEFLGSSVHFAVCTKVHYDRANRGMMYPALWMSHSRRVLDSSRECVGGSHGGRRGAPLPHHGFLPSFARRGNPDRRYYSQIRKNKSSGTFFSRFDGAVSARNQKEKRWDRVSMQFLLAPQNPRATTLVPSEASVARWTLPMWLGMHQAANYWSILQPRP